MKPIVSADTSMRKARGTTILFAAMPALLALSACGAQGAHPSLGIAAVTAPHGVAGAAMEDGGKALPPQGWLDFCSRNAADPSCRAAVLTPARATELQQVQTAIRKIPRRSDEQAFGVAEYWRVANRLTGGDCEDLALAARQKLITLGWPLTALRLATAWTEQHEYHLVLSVDVLVNGTVQTLVLDSRYPRVETYGELLDIGYRFHSRQAAIGAEWVKIEAASPPRVQMASLQTPAPSPVPASTPATAAIEASAKLGRPGPSPAVYTAISLTPHAEVASAFTAASIPVLAPPMNFATVSVPGVTRLSGPLVSSAFVQPFQLRLSPASSFTFRPAGQWSGTAQLAVR